MIRGLFMIATGLSGLLFGLKEMNLIQIHSVDVSAIANRLHHALEAVRSFFG
jgi:hypothetical protein